MPAVQKTPWNCAKCPWVAGFNKGEGISTLDTVLSHMAASLGTVGLSQVLGVGGILFTLGAFGLFWGRGSLITILMCIELMLLAVNLNFVAFSHVHGHLQGQVFALLILSVAAAEAAIGLAILVAYYRNRQSIDIHDLSELGG